ncbi:putative carboxypeptidase D [Dioscorea sansibarensis]
MKFSLPFFLFAFNHLLTPLVHGENEGERLLAMLMKKPEHKTTIYDAALNVNSAKDDEGTVYFSRQDGLKEADKITRLPGQPNDVKFDQYAGYVTVDPQLGRALFYYFVEAPKKSFGKDKKPLVLWLNGGPGCSSIGNGAMSELGPFFVEGDGKTLYENPHAWNNIANMLFLESPTGVGFSYSNVTSDYKNNGDKRTARDSYAFLINWLERFPEYKTSDFFITGESYAGHFIPQLANLILENNIKYKSFSTIKLKGIAIGNAYIETIENEQGLFDFLWLRSVIHNDTYYRIKSVCNITGQDYYGDDVCIKALEVADTEKGRISLYNIYAPICNSLQSNKNSLQQGNILKKGTDPCADHNVESYMNLPEVQTAFHANTTKLSHAWTQCSGDFDAIVSVTATQYSLQNLGLPIETTWGPWYHKEQVGGYYMVYKGLTYATVKGAGHMVPADQPERALELFRVFLEGKQFNTSSPA